VAVQGADPIRSEQDAVRASIAAEARREADMADRACIRLVAVLLVLVVVAGCGAGPRSRVETPASASMSEYRSYRWWRSPLNEGARGYSDNEERLDLAVRNVVESELLSRGYYQGGNAPDFVVRYGVALYEEPTPPFREYLTYYTGGEDMGAAAGSPAGTFVLEAIDIRTRRVAWRATAPDVIKHGPSGEQVTPAVRQMMESIPPRP
jgi:hypothetical protein